MMMMMIIEWMCSFRLLGLTPTTQLRNGLTCQSYRPFLGENTDYLCKKIPHLHLILHESNLQTRAQCQYHFRDHPWGCQLTSKVIPLRRFLRQGNHHHHPHHQILILLSISIERILILHDISQCNIDMESHQCLYQRSNQ